MIIVDDVYKRYQTEHGPGPWVLNGATVTLPPRVSVGLIGRNGAGKSTLLRLIGGIDRPTRGRIDRRCRVSWPMGRGGGRAAGLTGRQNARFMCRVYGHEDDIPDRLSYVQRFSGLGDAFDEPVGTYSPGMRARLEFALSLTFDFDVYIADEAISAGDRVFQKKTKQALKSLADHASIILVSHSEAILRQFCTAGIWLDQGKAHWFDDIHDALRAYKQSVRE